MKIKLTGRVIDSWKGSDERYPNTRVTLTDLELGAGQVKLSVPPSLVSLFAMDAKVSIEADVRCTSSNAMGQNLILAADAKVTPIK